MRTLGSPRLWRISRARAMTSGRFASSSRPRKSTEIGMAAARTWRFAPSTVTRSRFVFAPSSWRQLREELDRREGDVVEPPDAHVGPQLAQQRRHELQLVVLHPDGRALGGDLGHRLGEAPVDGLVARPPLAVE